ncbi:unnamed protein product, partial [Medioppia subpectinata]
MARSPSKRLLSSPTKQSATSCQTNGIRSGFDLKRKRLLHKLMDRFDGQITAARDKMFAPLMQSLFTFVSNNCLTDRMRETSFATKLSANVGLIPTALLSIGINSSEHKFICDLLVDTIQDLTSSVVYVNCAQTASMSAIFKAFSDAIMTDDVVRTAGLDDIQLKRLTFGSLFKIYEENVLKTNDNNFCPPIVVFLDDIENCGHQLVSTLILILKEYMRNIAFILIISKSNETTSLQYLLPSSATDYLLVHHFQTVSGRVVIDEIINEAFIASDVTFKLGPNVLDFMLKMFAKFDFSIQNIQHIIKYPLFCHFYANELSFLSQSTPKKLKNYIKTIDSRELKFLRDSQLLNPLLNDTELKKSITTEMSAFISTHNRFVYNLKLVLKLINGLIGCKDMNLVQLYANSLDTSYKFSPVIDSLNRLSQTQWLYLLDNCLSGDQTVQPLSEALKSRYQELISIDADSQLEPEVMVEKMEVSALKSKLSKSKTRQQWKETLKPVNTPKALSKFDVWKNDTIDLIEHTLRDTSTHPMSCPLSKVLFFDAIESVKPHIFVDQRNDTLNSLSTPLNDSKRSETDFHTLFAIFSESQSVINMYDWFESFTELIRPLNTSPKKVNSADERDTNIVRFLNSVSDCEYIGLLESSKRKADHLNRLQGK